MNPSFTNLFKKVAPFWAGLLLAPLLFHSGIRAQKVLVNIAPDGSDPGDSNPHSFGSNKTFAFFWTGQDRERKFWRTDGTVKGTLRLLTSNWWGPPKDYPNGISWGNQYFFDGWDPKAGWELFKTDGSLKGTQLVKDLDPRKDAGSTPLSSEPRHFLVMGNALYFVADTASGATLFKSDGTTLGTRALFSIQGELQNLTALGTKLVFEVTKNKFLQNGLAVSDGTPKGTHLFFVPIMMESGRKRQGFATLGNNILFMALGFGSKAGKEPYVSDGTLKGTKLLKDLWPGPNGSKPSDFEQVGNRVYFSAEDPKHGRELWGTTGTAQGTVLVKDIETRTSFGIPFSSNPTGFHAFGKKLFFYASTTKLGLEPWISDGTSQGTFLLKNLVPGFGDSRPGAFLPLGSNAYFLTAPNSKTYTLFRTDGTPAGTQVVKEMGLKLWEKIDLTLTPYGTRFLFSNRDALHGWEPWISDGTKAGTRLLSDITPRRLIPNSSNPRHFRSLGSTLYFATHIHSKPNHIWETDVTGARARPITPTTIYSSVERVGNRIIWMGGNQARTQLFAYDPQKKKTLSLLSTKSIFSPLSPLGDQWFFSEQDSHKSQTRFWATDGTASGTKQMPWLAGSTNDIGFRSISFGRRAILVGPISESKPQNTFAIVTTDGSKSGTKPLLSITNPVPIHNLQFVSSAMVGKELIFSVALRKKDLSYTSLLFQTNGTPAGTRLLKVLDRINLYYLVSLGGKAIFSAWEPKAGNELWISDGTPKGTKLLKDLWPGSQSSGPRALARVGNKIVFGARTPNTGWEIFVSDGTAKGTKLLKDIRPGKGDGVEQSIRLVSIGSRYLAFLGNDGKSGTRFWITDGTSQGTRAASPALPITPNTIQLLEDPVFALGRLFFPWFTPQMGKEPWVWFPGASARAYGFACGTSPRLEASDPVLGASMTFSGTLSPKQPAAVLLLGSTAQVPIQTKGGCFLAVDPFRLLVPVPIQAKLGKWSLPVPVPNQPSLRGLLFQAQMLHPLKAGGFDLSNPVECVLGT